MEELEWKSLGITKQLAYVNRLEEINRQKQALIKDLERQIRLLETPDYFQQ